MAPAATACGLRADARPPPRYRGARTWPYTPIGMGRSSGLKVVVIAGFGIFVAKYESDGRSRGDPFVDAAEPLDCVALLPWRGQVGLAGPPAMKFNPNSLGIQRQS